MRLTMKHAGCAILAMTCMWAFGADAQAAEKPENKNAMAVKVTLDGDSAIESGESIKLDVRYTYPDNYCVVGYRIFSFARNLPENFVTATGFALNPGNDPKLRTVNVVPWTWLPAKRQTEDEASVSLKTDKWPSGSYQFNYCAIFRPKSGPTTANTHYISGTFSVTIK